MTRFEVPNVGDADILVYYIEAKYKFNPHLCGAVRWNQQFFGDVSNGSGGQTPWDRDIWRVDTASGFGSAATWKASCNTVSATSAVRCSRASYWSQRK